MKICPQCNKTYNDDNLNFCLDDGSLLNQSGNLRKDGYDEAIEINPRNTDSGDNNLPETVMLNQPSQSTENASFNQGFGNGQQQNQPNWGTSAQPVIPAKKSSKTWIWVLGILAVLVLVCGGGLVGLIVLFSNTNNETNWNSDFGKDSNISTSNSRTFDGNKTLSTSDDRKDITNVDMEYWVKGDTELGLTDFENGEFLMNAQKPDYYYVIAAPKQFKSENATTSVIVRNTESADTNLGFGLVIHSDPQPLQKDYVFLIDSEKQRFRVVRHSPKNEITVVNWTDSGAIKSGTQENVLEVRDNNSKMNFYINGLKVAEQTNVFGYRGGVAGIYTGIASPIAFSDLKIRK